MCQTVGYSATARVHPRALRARRSHAPGCIGGPAPGGAGGRAAACSHASTAARTFEPPRTAPRVRRRHDNLLDNARQRRRVQQVTGANVVRWLMNWLMGNPNWFFFVFCSRGTYGTVESQVESNTHRRRREIPRSRRLCSALFPCRRGAPTIGAFRLRRAAVGPSFRLTSPRFSGRAPRPRAARRAARPPRRPPRPRGGAAPAPERRRAPRAERPDFWGAATAGEKCGAKASRTGDFAAAAGGV